MVVGHRWLELIMGLWFCHWQSPKRVIQQLDSDAGGGETGTDGFGSCGPRCR